MNHLVKYFFVLLLSPVLFWASAQNETGYVYERASIYTMMIEDPSAGFNEQIKNAWVKVCKPQRFNDHDLGVNIVMFAGKRDMQNNIELFFKKVDMPKKLVARWFCRNRDNGICSVQLIKERGYYNASLLDVKKALQQLRGKVLLYDAGEKLLGRTFVLMNEIYVVDRNVSHDVSSPGKMIVARVGASIIDRFSNNVSESLSLNKLLDDLKSFGVHVNSYLYHLKWDENLSDEFYNLFYTDSLNYDKNKSDAFDKLKNHYKLEFVGKTETTASIRTISDDETPEQIVEKLLGRALDKNISILQLKYPIFRVCAPITCISPLRDPIGLKEDVNKDSKYEVLERIQKDGGVIKYNRVGIVKPLNDTIWNNLYDLEQHFNEDSDQMGTVFRTISGGEFYPGMLIREIK